MLFLVTDTSGRHGSAGLVREEADDIKVVESVPLAGGTFSAQLVPQIAELLAKHALSKRDIDAFIVVSGPGSFTGLRVGLAAIKALAEILEKRIVPVSLLEVIAASSGTRKAMALLDAGRGEIYAGEYETGESAAPLVRESLLTKDEFRAAALGWTIATPDQALAQLARECGIGVTVVPMPASGAIARVGWHRLKAGQTVTPEQLEANYIRRSDAEIFAKSRQSLR
jgi:tRNA threonylcarbamoyladenosine biosynthesis protein TsaB